jgi:hypothetical protein
VVDGQGHKVHGWWCSDDGDGCGKEDRVQDEDAHSEVEPAEGGESGLHGFGEGDFVFERGGNLKCGRGGGGGEGFVVVVGGGGGGIGRGCG